MNSDFEKLVDSLTKQQQRRSDLEIAIRKADFRKKTLDGELAAMQRKEENMLRQIPDVKKDISLQNAFYTSQKADLRQLQNGCTKLLSSLDSAQSKVNQLQEQHFKDDAKSVALFDSVNTALNDNLVNITRAFEAAK